MSMASTSCDPVGELFGGMLALLTPTLLAAGCRYASTRNAEVSVRLAELLAGWFLVRYIVYLAVLHLLHAVLHAAQHGAAAAATGLKCTGGSAEGVVFRCMTAVEHVAIMAFSIRVLVVAVMSDRAKALRISTSFAKATLVWNAMGLVCAFMIFVDKHFEVVVRRHVTNSG
jgi:hypothetical protein